MTVNEIYEKAKALLGAQAIGIDCTEEATIKREAVKMMEMILKDLDINATVRTMSDTINCSENEAQALVYGLAMLVCTAFGISDRQPFFASLYASHRTHSKSRCERVRDILPKGDIYEA